MNLARNALLGTAVEPADAVATRVTEHYERRGRVLWGLARRLGATDEQAADVLQEAHLRLWRELTSGVVIDDIDGWTFRVAYRLVMDQHRLRRRVEDLVARLTSPAIESTTDITDEGLSLWPLVDRLPARERTTLYLRYRADLSFEQIASVMGISTASARTYGSRGVDRLRSSIGELEGDTDA